MPPGTNRNLSFERDIKGLFRDKDRQSMLSRFDLSSVDDVRTNAAAILSKLADGTMPCDGAWPAESVDLFRQWVQDGMSS